MALPSRRVQCIPLLLLATSLLLVNLCKTTNAQSSAAGDPTNSGGIFISGAELQSPGSAGLETTGLPSLLVTATAGAATLTRVVAPVTTNPAALTPGGVNTLSSLVKEGGSSSNSIDTSLTTITTTMLTVADGQTKTTVLTTAVPATAASAAAAHDTSHDESGAAAHALSLASSVYTISLAAILLTLASQISSLFTL